MRLYHSVTNIYNGRNFSENKHLIEKEERQLIAWIHKKQLGQQGGEHTTYVPTYQAIRTSLTTIAFLIQ